MKTLLLPVLLFLASPGFSQTNDPMQALLAEVHHLRQAIESMTVASQRVQIAVAALQLQDGIVARSATRLDDAQKRCRQAETERQRMTQNIQRMETTLATATVPDSERQRFRALQGETKAELDARTADVQACQVTESEAAGQLRNDRAKLAELQEHIERLDKMLEQQVAPPK